jgi:DNA invertase Pin-like site-specific DNA recombinase
MSHSYHVARRVENARAADGPAGRCLWAGGPGADGLGQGLLTSPGEFKNAAHASPCRTDLAANGRYELVDMLTNDHQSSRSRNRPQFGTAMNRILARDADAIIVWKASRFSRNWREAAEDVEPLPDHDKDLRSEKGFDTASTAGRLRLPILLTLAHWEHDRGGDITARPAAARREPPRASGRARGG